VDAVNLTRVLEGVVEHWSPRVVARVNDTFVKVAKVKGELTWHQHDEQDELFLVLQGNLRIEYRDGRSVELGPGDVHVVPRATQHNPVAERECWIALVEPVTTLHTGDVVTEKTRTIAEQLESP
jgi:mannose-6-phosphate isomerase-like protein (cupin superfamily)